MPSGGAGRRSLQMELLAGIEHERATDAAMAKVWPFANCIGLIAPDMSRFAVTCGQFSMIDAIFHCLHEIGCSEVSVWTWTYRISWNGAGFQSTEMVLRILPEKAR